MLVQIYDTEPLETDEGPTIETFEMPAGEVENFGDLMTRFGYEDSDGSRYVVTEAKVEYPHKFVIYVKPEPEPGSDERDLPPLTVTDNPVTISKG